MIGGQGFWTEMDRWHQGTTRRYSFFASFNLMIASPFVLGRGLQLAFIIIEIWVAIYYLVKKKI